MIDPLVVVISRGAVMAGDIEEPLTVLGPLLASPDSVRAFRERVDISWHGYDGDRRDLWEIEEVRDFVAKLDDAFPYWLYFLTRRGTGLLAVARCFLLPFIKPEADARINGPRLASLLERRWFPALNHIAMVAGLTEADVEDLCNSALEYLTQGPNRSTGAD